MIIHFLLLFFVLIILSCAKTNYRKKYLALVISFIAIGFYLALRYNYGLDYFHYRDWFYSRSETGSYNGIGTGEIYFLYFAKLFDRYYLFIIVLSIILVYCLYRLVRKYIVPKYYYLFFLFLMLMPGMIFTMLSALRSTLAACILWLALDLFYINCEEKNIYKRKWIINTALYLLVILFASMFHTSVLVFIVVPFLGIIIRRINPMIIFACLCVFDVLSAFYTNDFFNLIYNLSDYFEGYTQYIEKTSNATKGTVIIKGAYLVFSFFLCKYYKNYPEIFKKIANLSLLYLSIYFLGIDFEYRFTVYLFVFLIISLCHVFKYIDEGRRKIILIPIFMSIAFYLIVFYVGMYNLQTTRYRQGNYLYYETIFTAPSLP